MHPQVRGPAFPTDITYQFIPQKPPYIPTDANPNNAIYGDAVEPLPTPVSIYARGFRNPFDCTVSMSGTVVCTDNGSNPGNYGLT